MSALASQLASTSNGGRHLSEASAVSSRNDPNVEDAQFIGDRGFGGYKSNHVPNTYHPSLRNHENFSYANNNNMLNPPSGFNTQKSDSKLSFEDLVGTFVAKSSKRMSNTESRLDNLELHVTNMGATLKSLEVQIGQLTTAVKDQQRGLSSSDSGKNFGEVNVICIQPKEDEEKFEPTPNQAEAIPCKGKRVADPENVALTEVGSEEEKQMPKKLEDPRKFTVLCTIEGQSVGDALCVGEHKLDAKVCFYKSWYERDEVHEN